MTQPLIIYHGGCPDGFGAAWAAATLLGDVELYAARYKQPPPDVTDRVVYVVDFSYPRETLLQMVARAEKLRVFDHHASAEEDLEGLDFCVFDMDRSGAGITWDELAYGDPNHTVRSPRPWLIDYVEDRDLWRYELFESREVGARIAAEPYELDRWTALSQRPLAEVANEGRAILLKIDAYCRNVFVSSARQVHVRVAGLDAVVPVVNAPKDLISEVLHHALEQTGAPMAIGWYMRSDGVYEYSLRSETIDLVPIARAFGGGGHRKAAGFVSRMFEFWSPHATGD